MHVYINLKFNLYKISYFYTIRHSILYYNYIYLSWVGIQVFIFWISLKISNLDKLCYKLVICIFWKPSKLLLLSEFTCTVLSKFACNFRDH